MERENFGLCRSVSDGVMYCQHLREMVMIGMTSVREAYLTVSTALNSLEQLYSKYKTFMEMSPDEHSYQGVEFMM